MVQNGILSAQNLNLPFDSRRARILTIADSCFEVFTVPELLNDQSIRDEVLSSFTDSTESEVNEAISLALSWRRMLGESVSFCQ